MLGVLGVLLLIWIILIVIGAVVHALFWLIIVGAVLFVGTAIYGFVKRQALGRGRG